MAKSLDLVGKRFGSLVVLRRVENNSRGNTQWECLCDCGNKKIALGFDLNNGRTTTCGCKQYLKGVPSQKRIDIVGKKFGRLTVISLNDERSKNGVLFWNCMCDCGMPFVASGSNLKSGRSTHCGCAKKEFANNFIDISGKRYGRLTAIEVDHRKDRKVFWKCICDCGKSVVVNGGSLSSGHTKSCGCLSSDVRRENAKKRRLENRNIPTEIETYRRLQSVFLGMHRRCSIKYHSPEAYHDRGISICEEWKSFDTFLDWALKSGYKEGLTIDRIDVDGNYTPDNCRWVTDKEQQNNKRDNIYVVIDGERKTLKQWCEFFSVDYGMVKMRRKRGWPQSRWFEPSHH